MCLILVAWQAHPLYPLVVAANRDEFFQRPSAEAARWPEDPRVLAGRDLEAGGTWLGVREDGRFAAVTNVREPGSPKGVRSRGHLTRDFLLGDQTPAAYSAALEDDLYAGFNLLAGDADALWYHSNRDATPRPLRPGVYGLSNHLLDTPWPKLATAKARFVLALATLPALEDCFTVLADRELVPDHGLPETGVTLEWERLLSAIFVHSESYGTRASTVLTRRRDDRLALEERSFGPEGELTGKVAFVP